LVRYALDLRYPQRKYTARGGESAGHGISCPLEITNMQFAAVHCYIDTIMVSIKPVNDEPASRLTGGGTNLLGFKTWQVPVTNSVFCK
jgi:hypothetical protein